MQISKRLEAVAAMVTSGWKVADIGTDHAYIPIELVRRGLVPEAIAMDVNRGPLQKAEENIRLYGLEDKIETRLSDGLEALSPGEATSVVIAGMGGPLTIRILKEGAGRLEGCRELILQPQSEIRLVRLYLEEQGWIIDREEMILEDGKYYPMMHVVLPMGERRTAIQNGNEETEIPKALENCGSLCPERMTQAQLRYGPVLLRERHPVLYEFLRREQRVNHRILESLGEGSGEAAAERRREVEQELMILEEALAYYAEKENVNFLGS